MNQFCDYCKANLQGIEFKAKIRPKGGWDELLKQNGGSIRAVRKLLEHQKESRCTCNELHLKFQCSLNRNKKEARNELDTTLQQILTAYKNQDHNKETIISLARNTYSASDVLHCSNTLWKLSDIDLSHCEINELPSTFGKFLVGLKKLNLESNRLDEIPSSLTRCTYLVHLNLSRNRFSYLPSWLLQQKTLKHLNVSFNCLVSPSLTNNESSLEKISHQIEDGENDLKNWIQSVDHERNRVVYFNKRSGEVRTVKPNNKTEYISKKSLCQHQPDSSTDLSLPNVVENEIDIFCDLDQLLIDNNSLASIHKCIFQMTSLTVLRVQSNEITLLPLELGSLFNLRVFDVSKNKLKSIPDLQNCILMEEVNISSNDFDEFPDCILAMKNLKSLNISCNKIKRIPYKLGFHDMLSMLNVYHNPITDPPYELFTQNINQVRWECRQLYWMQQKGSLPIIPIHKSGIEKERLALDPDFDSFVLQKIEEANTKSFILELRNSNLSCIPNSVYTCKNIISICLQGNPLCKLDLGEMLPNLISLNLKDCKVSYISGSIKLLPNLEKLNLEGNAISVLPEELIQLHELKYLHVGNNKLVALPHELGRISGLVELHLNHNCVKEIPESISLMKNLEVLCASHNQLQSITSLITGITKLKTLNLRQNYLKYLPRIGCLNLEQLLLSNNEIEKLQPDFFLPNLKRSIIKIELNSNNLRELPFSFPPCRDVNLDMNPLKSPPLSLVNEGFEAVINYCDLRNQKILEFCKGLKSAGFEVSPSNFSPPVKSAIGNTGFLLPEDLTEFDKILDTSVNGNFFYFEYSVKKNIKDIAALKKRREQETHKKILDLILSELNLMNDPKTIFRSDIEKTFSFLENKMDCFAIPLKYVLLNSDNAYTIFKKVKTHLYRLDSLFSFDNTTLSNAFKFSSPFGPIACIQTVNYELGQNQDGSLLSLVIAKHIYSKQEAERKSEEEKVLYIYFKKMEDRVNDWASTKQGTRSINAEVSQRIKNINKAYHDCKKKLRSFRSESMDRVKIMQRRLNDYDKKQPYDFHFILDDAAADKLKATLQETKEKIAENTTLLEEKYLNAKQQKDDEIKTTMRNDAVDDMKIKCCHKVYEMVYKNGRAFALVKELDRPWDQNGFLEYRKRYSEGKESGVVNNKDDLTIRIEKLLQSTDLIWTNLDDMKRYDDNGPYTKFKQAT